MKHIVCFSGGKDSTAPVLWAKENLVEFTTVFCDTGWEHPITYAYVEEINNLVLGGKLKYLSSKKYADMMDCWLDHQMFSNNQARFCTEDMKIEPLHSYFDGLDDEVTAYQGVRADESDKRRSATPREWVEGGGGYWMERPLLRWTAEQVFDWLEFHDVPPNPLYLKGMSRVGCWPCVHANLRDLKAYLVATPEIKERIISAEVAMRERTGKNRTFFRHGFIPDRFCSIRQEHRGREIGIPAAEDVFRYIESVDENQLPFLPARSCMSVYNLCE